MKLKLLLGLSLACTLTACGIGGVNVRTPSGWLPDCEWPHCVSSLASEDKYFVKPIAYNGSREGARRAIIQVIESMEGARIAEQREAGYVRAEFVVGISKYVDDVQLVFPEDKKLIHIRSSSRIGYYDFGTNRRRVEDIRKRFEALLP